MYIHIYCSAQLEARSKGDIFCSTKNKIETTKSEIEAIPGKVAKSVEDKVVETTTKIEAIPGEIAGAIEKKVDDTVSVSCHYS